jgi:hypothetical protein
MPMPRASLMRCAKYLRQQTGTHLLRDFRAKQLQPPDFFFMRHAGSMRDAERCQMRYSPAVRTLTLSAAALLFSPFALLHIVPLMIAALASFRRRAARFRCHARRRCLRDTFFRHAASH